MPPVSTTVWRPLDGFASAVLVVLCVCWGLQQAAIKAAAPGMNPLVQIGLRSVLSAFLVASVILWKGGNLSLRDGTLAPGLGVGLLFALQFLCVAIGIQHTTASHMAVFVYTAPVFAALGLHWLVPGEKLRPGQLIGVCVAFAGVAVGFSNGFNAHMTDTLVGDTLGVAAGAF